MIDFQKSMITHRVSRRITSLVYRVRNGFVDRSIWKNNKIFIKMGTTDLFSSLYQRNYLDITSCFTGI